MKYTIILLIACIFSVNLYGQKTKVESKSVQLDIGYMYLSNYLNGDYYYNFKHNNAPDNKETSLGGLSIKLTIPSKIDYLDFIFGSIFLVGNDDLGSSAWSPGNTSSSDYNLSGGGIYFGISPKIKGTFIGLTSDFAIGVFSFKEYIGIFDNIHVPIVDVYDKKSSYGLGAMSSIGIYFKFGKIGINPSVNAIYSGGANASFLFYGFTLPISIKF